jgi:uncharacterized Rmd1/YagE family protein
VTADITNTPSARRLSARALLVAERIDTSGLERTDAISATPLAFRAGAEGLVVLFRYGVAVLIGLSPIEEDEVLRGLGPRLAGAFASREEETAAIEMASDREDHVPPGGPIQIAAPAPERLLVVADALAKSVVLARDEREVAAVLDVTEPFARHLAERGRAPGGRRAILRHIGKALLVQHRVSGRVAVSDKPDVLWDRPDLERLYARLADEYELDERAAALGRKLSVVAETATVLTDLIDTERALRLEAIIVALIVFEIVITFYQMATGSGGH